MKSYKRLQLIKDLLSDQMQTRRLLTYLFSISQAVESVHHSFVLVYFEPPEGYCILEAVFVPGDHGLMLRMVLVYWGTGDLGLAEMLHSY